MFPVYSNYLYVAFSHFLSFFFCFISFIGTIVSYILFHYIYQHEIFSFVNIFCPRVFCGDKPFQLSNIKRPAPSLFFQRGYPYISDLSIHTACFLTMLHSLYIWYSNFSLFISLFSHIFFPIHQLHNSQSISGILSTCHLMLFLIYSHAQKHSVGFLEDLLSSTPYR